MSTNVEGINYGAGAVLDGLTTPGGLSYVWAWDTTNLYLRFFDGTTSGGRRVAFYGDLPSSTVGSFNGRDGTVVLAAGDVAAALGFTPLDPVNDLADVASAAAALGNLGAAPLASPAFTGAPTAPTPASGDNSAKLATTGFVQTAIGGAPVPIPASTAPVMDGTAAIGSAAPYARADHVHPSDTSRLAVANNLADVASAAMARTNLGLGSAAVQSASAFDTAGAAAAVAATVPAASGTVPNMDGTGASGSSTSFTRADHIHPSDTSRLAVANNLADVAVPVTARINLSPSRVVSGTVAAAATDYTLFANTSGGTAAITLPASPVTGREIRVKDHLGNCFANPITVTGAAGATIDGQASWVMNVNYQADIFVWNGTQWSVMS